MKKLMMALAVVAFGLNANAMAVDWKYNSAKDYVGQNVYLLLGDTAKTDWANEAAVAAESGKLGGGESKPSDAVAKHGTKYYASGVVASDLITSKSQNYYLILVDAAGENFKVSSVYPGTGIYDPAAQESSEVTVTLDSSSFAGSWTKFVGTPGPDPVPEPTSGLLLLLGMAGLALRRKAK